MSYASMVRTLGKALPVRGGNAALLGVMAGHQSTFNLICRWLCALNYGQLGYGWQ